MRRPEGPRRTARPWSITTTGGDDVLEMLQAQLPWPSTAYSSLATETVVVRPADSRPYRRKVELTEHYLATLTPERTLDTTVHLVDETTWTWEPPAP